MSTQQPWSWQQFVFWTSICILLAIMAFIIACVWEQPQLAVDALGVYRSTITRSERKATDALQPPSSLLPPPPPQQEQNTNPAPAQDINVITTTNNNTHVGPWSNELEARAALQRLLRVPFVKVRPPWLLNPATGRSLECDCFNEQLGVCVEVSGRQHFEWPNNFHATREEFEQQLLRDRLKAALCALKRVKLIVVPHWIKRKNIEDFLRSELIRLGIMHEQDPSEI